MRLLIVSVDMIQTHMYIRLLRQDHTVIVAAGGEAALSCLEADPSFDLILTDVRMAGIDGWQLYCCLVQLFPQLTSKIVFWSTATANVADSAFAMGTPYIERPVNPVHLLAVLPFLHGG